MKLAIAYTTKNRPDLWAESLPRLALKAGYDLHIVDGSDSTWRPNLAPSLKWYTFHSNVRGGADASLAFCLSMMLNHEANYTHVGIVEQDVLLDDDWLEPTLELFSKGKEDGLAVGAVSPRSYVDRVLIQRDGYAVMHNLGAGCVIFTRDAAQIVLRTLRSGWWPDNVRCFAQLSGIDLRTYAAFRGNEQWVTTDWTWDAQLARRGLASLATTPARCAMIGQNPPLHEQGLELTSAAKPLNNVDDNAFYRYRDNLARLRAGDQLDGLDMLHQQHGETLIFPHQLPAVGATWTGELELKWSQGYGPFAYRAGPGGAVLTANLSGICSFQCTGGDDGARVTVEDARSGYKFAPFLPAAMESPASVAVPGGPVPRRITLELAAGATLYGLSCQEPQLIDTDWRFSWDQLPVAK